MGVKTMNERNEIPEIVIISGKGGTGKTSITGALAACAGNRVVCDADVDAADLHLLLNPRILETHEFYSGHQATIARDRCIECEECLDWCRFEAISPDLEINPLLCEGCGVCVHLCPAGAVDFPENHCGQWFISETRYGPLVHARLGIAEENSGKLVTLVRKEARRLAEERRADWILTDGPPGIGCPVIASLGGARAALVVTEPTVSGRHDLERVAELAAHFQVPTYVCVNKSDLYPAVAEEIERWCGSRHLTFVGHLPFDPAFVKAQVERKTIIEYDGNGRLAAGLKKMWDILARSLFREASGETR